MTAAPINGSSGQVRATCPEVTPTPRRICRTLEEIAQAGWDDAANDPPLTPRQVTRIALLLGPYVRDDAALADQTRPETAA